MEQQPREGELAGQAAPPAAGSSAFSSFNAATFFAAQEQHRAQREAELNAAADALLPSSSESDSESDLGEQHEEAGGIAEYRQQRRKRAASVPAEPASRKKAKPGGKERRKKGHKERRRRRDELDVMIEAERAGGAAARVSQVRAWAAPSGSTGDDFYVDTRGDPGNVAFGGLYRGDVAAYRRHDPTHIARKLLGKGGGEKGKSVADVRYFTAAAQRAQRGMGGRRWRRNAATQPESAGAAVAAAGDDYLPLEPEGAAGQQAERQLPGARAAAAARAESPPEQTREEEILQRTREFNAAIRERPEDLQLWLDFAAFQDEAAAGGGARRGRERAAAAEKKISILERALTHHPGADALLLALLEAAAAVCDPDELQQRWQRALAVHGGSARLWHAYMLRMRCQLSTFSAGDVAAGYLRAAAAVHREVRRQAAAAEGGFASEEGVGGVECAWVGLVLEGLMVQLQTGHTEAAVAAVQVLLEYNFFAPDGWPDDVMEMMLEDFWRSGAPLVGEVGSRGWAAWLAGEAGAAAAGAAGQAARPPGQPSDMKPSAAEGDQQGEAKQAAQQEAGAEGQGDARSAWEELAPAFRARFGHSLRYEEAAQQPGGGGGEAPSGREQGGEERQHQDGSASHSETDAEEEEEESEGQLLARLGMDLDAALEQADTLTPPVLRAWLREEVRRDSQQWQPHRVTDGEEAGSSGRSYREEEEEQEGEEGIDPVRRVVWSDVCHCLVRVRYPASREQLLLGCLTLLGAPVAEALLPGCPAARAVSALADDLSSAVQWLGVGGSSEVGTAAGGGGGGASLEGLPGDWSWLTDCPIDTGVVVGGLREGREAAGTDVDGGGGISTLRQLPWCMAHPGRQAFLVRLLSALVAGPGQQWPVLARALLESASWEVSSPCEHEGVQQQEKQQGSEEGVAPRRDWARGQGLARELLALQRDNLVLWKAYAQLESVTGAAKAARKVCLTCLSTHPTPLDKTAPGLAALTLHLAQLELGGPSGEQLLLPMAAAAAPAAAAAALRALAWLGSGGEVALRAAGSKAAGGAGQGPSVISQAQLIQARRGYQDLLLAVVRGGAAALDPALVSAAAGFELAAGVAAALPGGLNAGVKSALALYDQVLAALQDTAPGAASSALAGLRLQRCTLAVQAAQMALSASPPAAALAALRAALRRSPASPPLLRLLLRLELGGHAAGALRRELHVLLADAPSPQGWLAALAAEVATSSPAAAVQGALDRAAACSQGRGCPLLWRCRLRWAARRAGGGDALRRIFLRAVGICPWSKALWMDGLALLNGAVPPKELSEYVGVMRAKEVVVRTEVLEVVLAGMG